jgi:TonB family protein
MREAVSDVLAERSRAAEGLSRMVMFSLGAHLVLVAVLVFIPKGWMAIDREPDVSPMMISLDGSPGADTGGNNQIAGRAVQDVAPPEPKQPFALPPAAKTPEMVLPEAAKTEAPKPRVETPAEKSTNRKPITGDKVKPGERIDTGGAAVPFGGLSSSGGKGLGAQTFGLDNFCCPEYLETMVQLIRRQWDQNQGVTGQVVVRFVVRRDGMLTQVEVTKPSNNVLLDLAARRAVLNARQLPPLPAQFTEPNLTIHLTFEYQR